uniref:Putative secreted peptide n=1 Tax=Anopheles braziliensis TaxID=58242 RepID=A0A2M3ZP20_9DIPT
MPFLHSLSLSISLSLSLTAHYRLLKRAITTTKHHTSCRDAIRGWCGAYFLPSLAPPRSTSTPERSSWQHLAYLLPVGHPRFVERHEVDLTRGATFGTAEEHLVVPLAQELQTLCFLVHEHPVQVARFYRANLDCLVTPAHNLPGTDVSDRGRHLAPLQHDILRHAAHRVDVNTFVVVAQQQLHTVRVR